MLLMTLALVLSIQAQTPKPGDATTYLTPEQQAKYSADLKIAELEKKLDTYGKWVGVGGEVGAAVREGLDAVVDVADKFGKTDVGKFTMYMVAWKVIGKDLVRIVLGIIFIIGFTWFLIYSFKTTCLDRRVVLRNPGFMKYPKEYKIIQPYFGDGNGLGAIRFLHLVLFFFGIWITYGIMFV